MEASMSKTNLIESIVESTKTKSNKEFSKNDVGLILEEFFHSIKNGLNEGKKIQIKGFGNFEIFETKERQGRNPKTGETLTIPARKKVKFKVSKIFNENVLGEQE